MLLGISYSGLIHVLSSSLSAFWELRMMGNLFVKKEKGFAMTHRGGGVYLCCIIQRSVLFQVAITLLVYLEECSGLH